MNLLTPYTVAALLLMLVLGGLLGWMVVRIFDRKAAMGCSSSTSAPDAVQWMQALQSAQRRGDSKGSDVARTQDDQETVRLEERYQQARFEIEELIKIMDEVESDNIELDAALCKSIVEQERLQMMLHQREESQQVMDADRKMQELRMFAMKDELDLSNKRAEASQRLLQQQKPSAVSTNHDQARTLIQVEPLGAGDQIELLSRELAGKDRMLDQLRQELRTRESQLDDLHIELTCAGTPANDRHAANAHPTGDSITNVNLIDDVVSVQAPINLFSIAPRQVDRLQRIEGVGARLERKLNELGIYQFRQIAEFTAADLLWLDRQLGFFKGRMIRNNWVAQAESLVLQEID